MKPIFILTFCCLFTHFAFSQITNTGVIDTTDVDRSGKVTVGGYVDAYFGYDFNNPKSGDRPYFVSMARHNEFTINLAYIDVKYSSSRMRARFVPGFGTYINANYLREPGAIKNIIEASAGVRLFEKKEIWLDAGVFGSPYTNESAISKDHLVYSRSIAPEYVPYYLSGVKLTTPLNKNLTLYWYITNGWQLIQDNNSQKSFGLQVEYRPKDNVLLNFDTYVGDERSDLSPTFRTRYFFDFYAIYNPDGKFSGTACAYYGVQQRLNNTNANWYTANVIGRYRFNSKASLSGRLEYFDDTENVQISPITGLGAFSMYSSSLCLNISPRPNVLLRFESRTFFSDKNMYIDNAEKPSQSSQFLISSLTVWF